MRLLRPNQAGNQGGQDPQALRHGRADNNVGRAARGVRRIGANGLTARSEVNRKLS